VSTATPESPSVPPLPRTGERPQVRRDLSDIGAALRGVSWREPATAWRQLVELFGLTKLVVAGATIVLALAAFLLPGAERGDPFDGPGAAMDLVLKLGAVLALAYVSLAALKRYTSGSVSQRGSLLDVLDSTTLGPNRSVYVVRAGEKRLVLGVTQNQITALAELDPDAAPEAVA
jgi:flagellar biosynthetic protein FliO